MQRENYNEVVRKLGPDAIVNMMSVYSQLIYVTSRLTREITEGIVPLPSDS